MGEFNSTCIGSGAPIATGRREKVVLILLRNVTSGQGAYLKPEEDWQPIGWPIQNCTYDDFGGVCKVDLKDPATRFTLEVLACELGRPELAETWDFDSHDDKNLCRWLHYGPQFYPATEENRAGQWLRRKRHDRCDEAGIEITDERQGQERIYRYALVKQSVYDRLVAWAGSADYWRDALKSEIRRHRDLETLYERVESGQLKRSSDEFYELRSELWFNRNVDIQALFGGNSKLSRSLREKLEQRSGKETAEQLEKFLEPLVEYLTFYDAMEWGKRLFQPSRIGGQGQNYKNAIEFMEIGLNVLKEELAAYQDEYGDEDEDEA